MFYSIYWLHLNINLHKSWYDWLKGCNQKRNRSVTRIGVVTFYGYLLHFKEHLSKSPILTVITESISHFTVSIIKGALSSILAQKRNHLGNWLRFGYTCGYTFICSSAVYLRYSPRSLLDPLCNVICAAVLCYYRDILGDRRVLMSELKRVLKRFVCVCVDVRLYVCVNVDDEASLMYVLMYAYM